MQKTKLCSEIKNLLGIVASYKILSHWSSEKFVKIAVKTLFREIYMQKTKLWSEIKNLLGIVASYKIPPPLVPWKFRQNRRKTIISRDICKKRNYGSKTKIIWELILLIKYLLVCSPENFVKIAVKPLFHEIYARNEIMLRNRKPFGNWFFS